MYTTNKRCKKFNVRDYWNILRMNILFHKIRAHPKFQSVRLFKYVSHVFWYFSGSYYKFEEMLEMARKGVLLKLRKIASEIQINHALFFLFRNTVLFRIKPQMIQYARMPKPPLVVVLVLLNWEAIGTIQNDKRELSCGTPE